MTLRPATSKVPARAMLPRCKAEGERLASGAIEYHEP
jgi:hypothetical protein